MSEAEIVCELRSQGVTDCYKVKKKLKDKLFKTPVLKLSIALSYQTFNIDREIQKANYLTPEVIHINILLQEQKQRLI
jgi:hypothetical protein